MAQDASTPDLSAEEVRANFNLDPSIKYFNSAFCAPPPLQVVDAMSGYYRSTPLNYRSGRTQLESRITDKVDAIRAKLAASMKAASPAEIVFTKNTTEAVNIVANGFTWKPGDEVILTPLEHQSNLLPWIRLESTAGVSVKYAKPAGPDGLIDPSDIARLITSRTRLISMHHVSNVLGCIQDIEAVCAVARERGVPVMIDAAQSEGRIDVDVQKLGCDLVVSCGRKALLGPQGIGFLWGREEILGQLNPLLIGGQSTDLIDEHTYTLKDLPFRHESGIINTAGVIGLGAALDFVDTLGRSRISSRIQALENYFLDGLAGIRKVRHFGPKRGNYQQTGIVSFAVEGMSAQTVSEEIYKGDGIVTAGGNHGSPLAAKFLGVEGVTRLSMHCFNTHDELDAALRAIERVAAG
ncbi:MAG: aminotransferase class V-fold PLP-dependent enzyme [Variibacter sp.]